MSLPLGYVKHVTWRWFCQKAFVNWPQSTKNTKQGAFSTAIWPSYQQMHPWLHLERGRVIQDYKGQPTINLHVHVQ